jgi:hypothetical protein
MTAELPIACTLPPADVSGRLELIDALAAEALLDQRPIAGGLRARFRDAPGIDARVRGLAAAEAECCAFLRFEVAREGGAVTLDITGAPDAQPVIHRFFATAHGP